MITTINTARPITNGLMNEKPVDAIIALLVVEFEVAPVVAGPLELVLADPEREDAEVDGFGHALLYTYC
jgi:hypothetical protein